MTKSSDTQSDTNSDTQSDTNRVIGSVTTATLAWGLVPLVVVISNASQSPILFMSLWSVSGICGIALYLWKKDPNWFSRDNCKEIWKKFVAIKSDDRSTEAEEGSTSIFATLRKLPGGIFQETSYFARFQTVNIVLYAWATLYVHDTIAAVVYESWPIFFIFSLRNLLDKEEQNKLVFGKRAIFLTLFAFASVILILFSNTFSNQGIEWSNFSILGFALLVLAVLFNIQNAIHVKLGKDLAKSKTKKAIGSKAQTSEESSKTSEQEKEEQEKQKKLAIRYMLSLRLLSSILPAIVGFLIFGVFKVFNIFPDFNGTMTGWGIVIVLVAGAMIQVVGMVGSGKGALSKNLGVNAIHYFSPIFGLIFLVIFSPLENTPIGDVDFPNIGDLNWYWIAVGLFGLVTANFLIKFEVEKTRFGLSALVVLLCVTGTLVLFRDDWWIGNGGEWLVGKSIEYYSFLTLSATVFTLLLAFQVTNLNNRIAREEALTFSVLGRLELLFGYDRTITIPKNKKAKETITIIEGLEKLNEAKTPEEIKNYYENISGEIEKAKKEIEESCPPNDFQQVTDGRLTYLAETQSEINTLAHSKQSGRRYGELVAIVLLAILTIMLTLSTRPGGGSDPILVFIDSFAFLFSTAIAFLVFNLLDLRNDRLESIIHRRKKNEETNSKHYLVNFRPTDAKSERRLSISFAVVAAFGFGVLICLKWLA